MLHGCGLQQHLERVLRVQQDRRDAPLVLKGVESLSGSPEARDRLHLQQTSFSAHQPPTRSRRATVEDAAITLTAPVTS